MRSRSRPDLGGRLVGLLPHAAIAVAEGAWINVLYAAVTIGLLRLPVALGVLPFALAAGLGIAVTRRHRAASRQGTVACLAVVVAAALLGWVADPAVRTALFAGTADAAIAANPVGLLVGLAAWRGTRYRDPESADLAVAALLAWGIPGLALPWLLGSASPVARGAFAAEALPATLLFVAAGLAAIGLLRLDAVSRAAGEEWRARREWPALIGGVVILVLVLGVPAAILLDVPVDSLFRSVVDPLTRVGGAAAGVIQGVLGGLGPVGPPPPVVPGPPPPPPIVGPSWIGDLLALIDIIVLVGLVVLAVAFVIRGRHPSSGRASLPPPGPGEVRHLVLPTLSIHRPRLRLPRFARFVGARPGTAAEAYAALMEDRADDPATARRPSETPAGHARRLRAIGRGAWGLDLLAADYALERYAGRRLTLAEGRRALARWRRLRRGWPAHGAKDSRGTT